MTAEDMDVGTPHLLELAKKVTDALDALASGADRANSALDALAIAAKFKADEISMGDTGCVRPRFAVPESEYRGRVADLINERDFLRRAIRNHREAAKVSPIRATGTDKTLWAALDAEPHEWTKR